MALTKITKAMMADDSINETTTHKDAILKIKQNHPKPE